MSYKPGKSNTKQKNLFDSWKSSNEPTSSYKGNAPGFKRTTSAANKDETCIVDLCDDGIDDDDLINAAVQMENKTDSNNKKLSAESVSCMDYVNDDGFDIFSGDLWIYPTNYPVRDYQFSIVKTALFKNTLVALPTGLGKTFIAAVVLYNFYRWYPQGKVVFMAPTKPLVSQQIEACYKIMGIPMEDQVQITGATMIAARRSEIWASKRVFFATPQVISNDLAKGVCPATSIKCLVIDEAHKALGNHAYCQVVQQLLSHSSNFRVLALSATPGSDLKTVQQVIKNLLISRIEIRADDAIDIKQYTHTRCVEKVVVKLTKQIVDLRERYFTVIQMFINNLVNNRALYNKDIRYITKYALLMARDQFRKDPPSGLPRQLLGTLEGTFAISISLYHGLELLLQHGMKSFFIFLKGLMDGSKGSLRSKTILYENPAFRSVYEELTECFGTKPDSVVLCTQAGGTQHSVKRPVANVENVQSYTYSHPKMEKLEKIVVQHFEATPGSSNEVHATRVMIFCQYRDIVREITELLQRHRPLVRPMQFVGHALSTNPNDEDKSGAKSNRRFTQKDQLLVVNKFRSGDYNTLVSTCVGEEGLDIGDVDLIICYDSHKSPIRLVQRMGRTGRKRKGKIVMLVTEGKEERDYNSSLASRRSIHKAIMGAGKSLEYYPHSPAMIPPGLRPTCHKMFITVPDKKCEESKKTRKKNKEKKPAMPDVAMMLKKSAKSLRLSEEQRDLWKNKFMLSDHEKNLAKTLPPKDTMGRCIYLEKEVLGCYDKAELELCEQCLQMLIFQQNSRNELWGDNCGSSNAKFLSLTEWLPWQSRLQQTKSVDHSSRSKMLSEVLQFCDTLREKGPTQCGYKTNVISKQVGFGREKVKKFTALKPVKKKIRKPLIVLSDDDEDYLLPDDFHDLPPFCNKTSSDTAEDLALLSAAKDQNMSISSHKSLLLSPQKKQLCEDTTANFNEIPEPSLPQESPTFRSRFDSENSIVSANLSALNISPEHDSDTTTKPAKVSKAMHNVSINLPQDPVCVESISFNYFGDDCAASAKSNKNHNPTCFKLWDSDEEKQLKNDFSSDKHVSGPVKDSSILLNVKQDFEDESTLLSLLEDIINEDAENRATELTQTSTKHVVLHEPKNATDVKSQYDKGTLDTAHMSKSNNCNSKASDSVSHFVANTALPRTSNPCQFTKPLCNPKTDSFDVSADMFAPQFELDFDLGFTDLESNLTNQDECKKSPDFDNREKCKKSPDFGNRENKGKRASGHRELSNYENNIATTVETNEDASVKQASSENQSDMSKTKLTAALSPVSMNSFNLSQNKRLENRKLFSELNFSSSHILPCAKVKPQLQNMKTANDSCSIIGNSLVLNKPKLSTKNEKARKLNSPFLTKLDFPISDDEDFEANDETLNFKKRRLSMECTDKDPLVFPIADSPFPTDEEWSSNSEMPFKDNYSTSDDVVFNLDENKSPVLSLTAKKKHKTTPSSTPQCEVPFARVLIGETKHSTPKSETPQKDTMSECNFSDESIISRRPKLKKKRPLRRNVFVCDEADVSIDAVEMSSDEEEDEELDDEMKDFVNDATQITQLNPHCPDERGIYLRSLNNMSAQQRAPTEMLGGRYKLAYGLGEDMDVFSQVPDKDVSDYANDSFCVQNDDVDEVSDLGEITLLESQWNVHDTCRPKTRAQAKLKKVSCNPVRSKSKKRLVIFDDEEADSSLDILAKDQTDCSVKSSQPTIQRIVDTSARYCEVCGAQLITMGWLCKDCIAVMKKSELLDQHRTEDVPGTSKEKKKGNCNRFEKERDEKKGNQLQSNFKPNKLKQLPVTLTMTKDERLKRSKRRQEELRKKLKSKRSSLDSNEDHSEKITIFINKQEISCTQQMTQALRASYNVNVKVVSLQYCSCVVSRRCAVICTTVDDVTNHAKRQKLSHLVKQSNRYYSKLVIIVEKSKAKTGKINSRPSSTIVKDVTSTLSCTVDAELQVLHSDGQESSARLLHMLASRERSDGQSISEDVLRCSNDETLHPLMNIYLSLPGVSYVHALYMCLHFDSLNTLVKSSLETLTGDIHLSVDTAKKLLSLFRKKFDISTTPL